MPIFGLTSNDIFLEQMLRAHQKSRKTGIAPLLKQHIMHLKNIFYKKYQEQAKDDQ
jgi:hypothetical protein